MDEEFSLKQHELLVSLLAATVREKGKNAFFLPLKRVASIYGFEGAIKDEEALDYFLDEMFAELAELVLTFSSAGKTHTVEQSGIVSMDYAGDGRSVHFEVIPGLSELRDFSLAYPEEEE